MRDAGSQPAMCAPLSPPSPEARATHRIQPWFQESCNGSGT